MPQKSQTQQLISKETTIGEIVDQYPETIETLLSYGVHCVGCHVSPFESLEDGFRGHGLSDGEIEEAVEKINIIIKDTKTNSKKETKPVDISNPDMTITDKAAEQIKNYMKEEKKKALRISVIPGGCSGFQYGMELDDEKQEGDLTISQQGITVYVDKESMPKLQGTVVDFVQTFQGSGFKITNPNAKSGCGCGKSFD